MTTADASFDLSEAKLAPPPIRRGTVAKDDVMARLEAAGSPLATVVAPAGYGKTTLLARWAEADPRPFAWVALDGRDDDPLVFLRYISGAIHRIDPLPADVFDALSGPGDTTWTRRVPRLGRALRASRRPFVLVLDDLHAIANPDCLDVLAALLGYVPAGSQMAIASREEPALPIARWRAQGQLEEIGVSDLRLDEREAGLLLAAAGVKLDPLELTELTERTEGWPAGLYLAALSLQAGGPTPASAASFAGDDRLVSDYFRLEVLARLPPADAQFLKQTSVLERMRGDLCDAVLQATGSAQTLERLARTNGFVVPLDRRGEWYRYHHLFGRLLHNELDRAEPDVARALNARAMTWCLAHDRAEEAIVYGHAAGETDVVAGLLDVLALPLHYDGRMQTLEEWLGWFSDDELADYPALAVYGAWVRVLTGRPADAERWLGLADGARSRLPLSDGSATHRSVGRRAPGPHDARRRRAGACRRGSRARSAPAGQRLGPDRAARSWRRARARRRDGRSRTDDLVATIERGQPLGAVEEILAAEAELALLAARQGAWDEARRRARTARALSTRRASPTTRRARWRTSRRHAWRSTTRGPPRPVPSWRVRTVSDRCSTTASRG